MSVIQNIIDYSNFELIRSRIASILADELANQKILYAALLAAELAKPEPDPVLVVKYELNIDSIPDKVWEERFRRPDPSEFPVINVVFTQAPLDDLITGSTEIGVDSYQIEVYQQGKDKEDNRGDYLSSIKLHRLLAIARTIIMNPNYVRLGFNTQPLIIGYRQATGILIGQPDEGLDDAINTISGKFIINVKTNEGV